MQWTFDHEAQWESASAFHDEGSPFVWRIRSAGVGLYSVCESDSELTTYTEMFTSLGDAKNFCEQQEASMVAEVWIYEDELPDGYDYDGRFAQSRVIDGVRMFPAGEAVGE